MIMADKYDVTCRYDKGLIVFEFSSEWDSENRLALHFSYKSNEGKKKNVTGTIRFGVLPPNNNITYRGIEAGTLTDMGHQAGLSIIWDQEGNRSFEALLLVNLRDCLLGLPKVEAMKLNLAPTVNKAASVIRSFRRANYILKTFRNAPQKRYRKRVLQELDESINSLKWPEARDYHLAHTWLRVFSKKARRIRKATKSLRKIELTYKYS